MTDTSTFDRQVALLTGGQMPRVWSLLVTVFGDLTLPETARISGRAIGQITAAIGIKPEATRVALHRLRKEGWIETERRGRESHYALTELGRTESARARPLIYGPAPALASCRLALIEPGEKRLDCHYLTSDIALALSTSPQQTDVALPVPLPDWMRALVCDPALVVASQDACRILAELPLTFLDTPLPSPLHRAVLRTLIVHLWRRVALRAPRLPDEVFPQDWQGAECRRLFYTALATLPRPDPGQLEQRHADHQAA